jgi:hypothetical protein
MHTNCIYGIPWALSFEFCQSPFSVLIFSIAFDFVNRFWFLSIAAYFMKKSTNKSIAGETQKLLICSNSEAPPNMIPGQLSDWKMGNYQIDRGNYQIIQGQLSDYTGQLSDHTRGNCQITDLHQTDAICNINNKSIKCYCRAPGPPEEPKRAPEEPQGPPRTPMAPQGAPREEAQEPQRSFGTLEYWKNYVLLKRERHFP